MARQVPAKGRPLSPEMAWAILLLASGDESAAAQAVRNPRYWSRAHAWLRSHSLVEHSNRLRARAEGLVGGDTSVELSAPAGRREGLIDEHVLEPGPGPLRIHWVSDEI
jgi:hypothetical protein